MIVDEGQFDQDCGTRAIPLCNIESIDPDGSLDVASRTCKRRYRTRPQSSGLKEPERRKTRSAEWSTNIPEIFCGTPEGCIAWSFTHKYAAASTSRGISEREAANRLVADSPTTVEIN